MIFNYLRTALRNLRRESVNTLINIAGLTLGITGSLILFLIVNHGRSYDTYHANYDRIYRVVSKSKGNDGYVFTQGIPTPLPEALKNDFPEIEQVAFTSYLRNSLITINPGSEAVKKYEEPKGLAYSESSFFKIFDREIIVGSSKSLDKPNEAVISKKWAMKYFGKEDAIGETLEYDNIAYTIAAVMSDYPTNTDLPFDLILSSVTIRKQMDEKGWGDIADINNCYVLVKEGKSISQIETRIPAFAKKYLGENSEIHESTFILQPLGDLHSDNRFGNYNTKLPKEAQIIFSVIAIFLIITACINFINLTTAEAIKRTKEVGIRKILGSSRKQLILQFLIEALMITVMAVILSLAFTQLALGFINPFMELSLALNLGGNANLWLFLVALIISVTTFSGLYPALVVSASKPVLALKNQLSTTVSSGYTVRKGLVVLQLFISQFFIIATIVLVKQMDYIQKQDVGFAKDAIITIPIPSTADSIEIKRSKMHSLKNQVKQLAGVENVSLDYAPPSFKAVVGTTFTFEGKAEEYNTQVKQVDGDYMALYNIQLLAGEKLGDADSMTGFVVNETLVKLVGFATPEEIIGKEIYCWGKSLPVKGVVKDFNTTSLTRAVEPVVLLNNIDGYQSLSVKLNPHDMQATIEQVQDQWQAAYPEFIFNYNFVDEQIRSLYKGERKISFVLSVFATMAIAIGCLGLFGLVTYMANQKTKEIGVRKVLGATVTNIMMMFTNQFLKLIVIGFVLAAIPVWFLMSKLLEEFAYRITLGPTIFMAGFGITFLITLLTVGFRSFRASIMNPTKSLRSE